MLGAMKLSRLAVFFTIVLIAGFAGLLWTSLSAINTLKVGGATYTQIILGKDLIADILPPPEYLIESYLETTQLLDDPGSHQARGKKLAQLRKDYGLRHDYWLGQSFDGDIKDMMTRKSHAFAMEFWKETEEKFLPAIESGNMEAARASYAALTRHCSMVTSTRRGTGAGVGATPGRPLRPAAGSGVGPLDRPGRDAGPASSPAARVRRRTCASGTAYSASARRSDWRSPPAASANPRRRCSTANRHPSWHAPRA